MIKHATVIVKRTDVTTHINEAQYDLCTDNLWIVHNSSIILPLSAL